MKSVKEGEMKRAKKTRGTAATSRRDGRLPVNVHLDASEKSLLKAAAARSGMALATWSRVTLLIVAKKLVEEGGES